MLRHVCRNAFVLRNGSTSKAFASAAYKKAQTCQRSFATVTDTSLYPKPGERIHGFTLNKIKHVPELHLTALQLQHDKTGAEYLYVARDDKNNVFAINFRTNPTDSTGLPHILEHVTLCGSEKYPVRDPFFKMMPRSLANFMNAFTAADYTSYPFATTNKNDFRNLSSVYLDAVLHPLLKRSDFLQEGWRLGPENPRDPASIENLQFKGVVYNEMKGQMSDTSYVYYVRFRDHIFPSLHNSGGDPEKMTELTHEQLVDFSRKHYHPSNARIFSYGDLDLADHLEQVDRSLSRFNRIAPDLEIMSPLDLSKGPLSFKVSGPIDTMQDSDRQTKSSVSWLACDVSDIVETFSVSIVMSLLTNGYGSPLYQGLIETGLGTNFSPNSGFDTSGKIGILSIGLDGMKTEDVSSLKDTIQHILREKSAEAFLPHKVEGYMHQLEIALKHKTASFGMGLLDKTLPAWFHGVDPLEGLAWNDIIEAFRQRMKDGTYLHKLVEKYFLNDRCLQFTMEPSESFSQRLESDENKRRLRTLEDLVSTAESSEAVIKSLAQQELDLLHEQEQAQTLNLETLPTLRVSDIPRQKEKKPVNWSSIGPANCLWRETETNGITYFQGKHVLDSLPDELRPLMPLFTESLMRLGTKTKSVGDLEAEVLLKTGGISISPFTRPDPWSLEKYSEGLMIDGYALDRNVAAMLDLMRTLLLDIDFASPKALGAIRELLESKNSGALDSVAEGGNHFAITRAAAALTRRGQLQEQLSGLSQIETTTQMLAAARNDPDSLRKVVEKLELIKSISISNTSAFSMRVACEPSQTATNQELLANFLQGLPNNLQTADIFTTSPTSPLTNTSNGNNNNSSSSRIYSPKSFFNLPFQVSYTGVALQTVPFASPDKAPLAVLGQLLTHNHLHPTVREKGGAYGASASASPISGLFTLSSYRDPNPKNTLSVFENAGRFAFDRDWSARELEESKLSLFQQIDAPTSVMTDGVNEFVYGITEQMEQDHRERLLDVTAADVRRVAQEYLVDPAPETRSVCVLGEKKAWVNGDGEWAVKELKMA